jgi:hypothetical protein
MDLPLLHAMLVTKLVLAVSPVHRTIRRIGWNTPGKARAFWRGGLVPAFGLNFGLAVARARRARKPSVDVSLIPISYFPTRTTPWGRARHGCIMIDNHARDRAAAGRRTPARRVARTHLDFRGAGAVANVTVECSLVFRSQRCSCNATTSAGAAATRGRQHARRKRGEPECRNATRRTAPPPARDRAPLP